MPKLPSPGDEDWIDGLLIDALRARDIAATAEAIRAGAPVGDAAREIFAQHFEPKEKGWKLEFGYSFQNRPPESETERAKREAWWMIELEDDLAKHGKVTSAVVHVMAVFGVSKSAVYEARKRWKKRFDAIEK
jgi:hypothetical protein